MNFLNISILLFYLTIVVWLFPPIRQFKTNLFVFFLILAILDPINLAFGYIFKVPIPGLFWVLSVYFLLLAIVGREVMMQNKVVLIVLLCICFVPTVLGLELMINFSIMVFLYLIIFVFRLKELILTYVHNKVVNIFHIILLFYLLTLILKVLGIILGFANATAYFFITSIFQSIFGFYFSIFREDNPRFIIKF